MRHDEIEQTCRLTVVVVDFFWSSPWRPNRAVASTGAIRKALLRLLYGGVTERGSNAVPVAKESSLSGNTAGRS